MDLLKIFRMQEPVPKDLLSKNPELGKYREVVHEKDVLLRNCKARIRELEQQVSDLKTNNRQLELQLNPESGNKVIKEYQMFYSKIMVESEQVVQEKNQMATKLVEMENFCHDLMEKYDKSRKALEQYEEINEQLKQKIKEDEEMINSLTTEYNRLKDFMQKKAVENETKSPPGKFKELILKNTYSKSMFEPLKGLDK